MGFEWATFQYLLDFLLCPFIFKLIKSIKPVNPKGKYSSIFIGRTGAETETPILWPPDMKIWLIGKDPDTGKDQRQEEKGMTEDEMVGWHHWLNGHKFEQTPGIGDGQEAWRAAVHWVAKSQTQLRTTQLLLLCQLRYDCLCRQNSPFSFSPVSTDWILISCSLQYS